MGEFDVSPPLRSFSASSAPSPQHDHSFSALCPAARHSFTVYSSFQNPVSSPRWGMDTSAMSKSESRHDIRRHNCNSSKQLSSPSSVFSPVNLKARDIPCPVEIITPVNLLQGPNYLQTANNILGVHQIFSPSVSTSSTVTVSFKSPLHPALVRPANPKCRSALEATPGSKPLACVARHKSHSGSSANQMPICTSSSRESVLIVDCGCRPNLSASFRKTKQKLQSCSSSIYSSSKPGRVTPSHKDVDSRDVVARSRSCSDAVNQENAETWTLLPKQGRHGSMVEAMSKIGKLLAKRRTRKKTDAGAMNPTDLVHISNGSFKMQERACRNKSCDLTDMKLTSQNDTAPALFIGDPRSLIWDKEFSSFTSEDTFFSSFERSRPSFSSISSSEYFDKKPGYKSSRNLSCTNYMVASSDANSGAAGDLATILPSKTACKGGNQKLVEGRVELDAPDNSFHGLMDSTQNMGVDPLIEVSFHGVNDKGKSLKVARRKPPTRALPSQGAQRSSCVVSSLVGIKEDPREFNPGPSKADDLNKNDSLRRCTSSSGPAVVGRQLTSQRDGGPCYEVSSPSPDDYAKRSTPRSRKKRNEISRRQPNEIGHASIFSKQGQLSEKQIRWCENSSEDDTDVSDYARNVSPLSSSVIHLKSSTFSGRRRRESRVKKATKPLDPTAQLEGSNVANSSTLCADSLAESHCNEVKGKLITAINGSTSQRITQKEKSVAINSTLIDSEAVVKCSKDPVIDFRDSMLDMILEKQIYWSEDLEELLDCFLSLNACEHHDAIIRAFKQVWKVFHEPNSNCLC